MSQMELKSEVITYRDEEFEVRELTVGQIAPMFDSVDEDGKARLDVMILMKMSVHQNGEPLGESLEELPAGLYSKLLQTTMRVNDIGVTETEGNA